MPLGGDRATATTRATRRTPIGATWYCSTSTSTAPPVGGWARVTKPGGPRSSLGASRISRTPARASARHPSPSPIRLQEHPVDHAAEWLEADGLGGFASGTVGGTRTRRYHALLLAATNPPTGRVVLVNGFDASVETPGGTFALSSQAYVPDVIHPDGTRRIIDFKTEPRPQWIFELEDGARIQQELFVRNGSALVALSWHLLTPGKEVKLSVRPFLSGRDYHSMHHENPAFQFEPQRSDYRIIWHPYNGLPGIVSASNGDYSQQ